MARLELELADEEARVLRGALLAARATELAEANRRGFRHSYGKGSDSARETMSAEVAQHRARIALLDRLLEALERREA
jgi:hypothetical protein